MINLKKRLIFYLIKNLKNLNYHKLKLNNLKILTLLHQNSLMFYNNHMLQSNNNKTMN